MAFKCLKVEDVSADVLWDLRTHAQTLSLWKVTGEDIQLHRVIAALASTGQTIDDLAYVLLDHRDLKINNLVCEQSPGRSADATANGSWHYDLIHLTTKDVAKVSRLIAKQADSAQRVFNQDVNLYLLSNLREGHLDLEKFLNMKREVKAELKAAVTNAD